MNSSVARFLYFFGKQLETKPITRALKDYPKELDPHDPKHVADFIYIQRLLSCLIIHECSFLVTFE